MIYEYAYSLMKDLLLSKKEACLLATYKNYFSLLQSLNINVKHLY